MSLVEREKIPTFDFIVENIYLGDVEAALSEELLRKNEIDFVINLSNTRYQEYENIEYFHIDIEDESDVEISTYFNIVNEKIKEHPNTKILIHCMNSVSRSVTVVLQYLLQKMNLKEAYEFLKSKRKQYTRPNRGFIRQLLDREKSIYGCNSMKLKDFFH